MPELFNDQVWAISLWQSWASLWLTDLKPDETRHWMFPRHLRGERILVHASKRPPPRDLDERFQQLCCDRFGSRWRETLPRGGFIGSVILASCLQIGPQDDQARPVSAADELCGNWEQGRFAWLRHSPITFERPIPAVGRQGFWRVPRELVGEVLDG